MRLKLRAFILSLLFAGMPSGWAAENIPTLHAKVTYPVLQEIMGGCSLRCAFFWETLAGNPAKPAPELCDDDAMTGWMAPDDWKNTPITFRLPEKLPRDCRDTPFYGLSVANGVIDSPQAFRSHARVRTMLLSLNGKPIARLTLADTWKWQDFRFGDVLLNQGDGISLTIEEIYPGKESQQPVLTEIVLQGAH
jgi:hypothetical protein